MDSDDVPNGVGAGYAVGQLASALITELTHHDGQTRRRAASRRRDWESVLKGMASGKIQPGSRTPVRDMPAWVTPKVVRGGFATGEPAAGGDLTPDEVELCARLGLPQTRSALFAFFVSDPGIDRLLALLQRRTYRLGVPEEAALLVVAWLIRAGETLEALQLLETIRPFAGQLRFWPRMVTEPLGDPEVVSRETVADAGRALAAKRSSPSLDAMREAILVWAPFGDALLDLFLTSIVNGQVLSRTDAAWHDRARLLLAEYGELAEQHTKCSKHRKPKENVAILRVAADDIVAGRAVTPRQRGLVQVAVTSMLARRGSPGSPEHERLRWNQNQNALSPSHPVMARLLAQRLKELPQDRGIVDRAPLMADASSVEAEAFGVPTGASIPSVFDRVLLRAIEGSVETLVARGAVPSAEVLARLVPQIAAQVTAQAYEDGDLSALVGAMYVAFRSRRSLLLLNLESQVRQSELPWVHPLERFSTKNRSSDPAKLAVRRLAYLTIDSYPATIVPNPMVRELDSLAREADFRIPFVEELAADIFMGTFSRKFADAARVAADVLPGSVYERYYGIDYASVRNMPLDQSKDGVESHLSTAFAELCRERAQAPNDRWSVAANGMIIEQSQILTTHNLAALVGPVGLGADLAGKWSDLADRSLEQVSVLLGRVVHNPRPLRTVKDAAYGWRQLVFYLSFADRAEQIEFVDRHASLAEGDSFVQGCLRDLLAGLRLAVDGAVVGSTSPRAFVGWAAGEHWILARR
jgi:hypothetical protein